MYTCTYVHAIIVCECTNTYTYLAIIIIMLVGLKQGQPVTGQNPNKNIMITYVCMTIDENGIIPKCPIKNNVYNLTLRHFYSICTYTTWLQDVMLGHVLS